MISVMTFYAHAGQNLSTQRHCSTMTATAQQKMLQAKYLSSNLGRGEIISYFR